MFNVIYMIQAMKSTLETPFKLEEQNCCIYKKSHWRLEIKYGLSCQLIEFFFLTSLFGWTLRTWPCQPRAVKYYVGVSKDTSSIVSALMSCLITYMHVFFKPLLDNFPRAGIKSYTWSSKKRRHMHVWRIYIYIYIYIYCKNQNKLR